MEDAATAEISRSQVWQWIHQDRSTDDGTPITRDYVEGLIADVLGEVERREGDRFDDAAEVFRDVALREEFPAFLTLTAYTQVPGRDRLSRTYGGCPGPRRSGASVFSASRVGSAIADVTLRFGRAAFPSDGPT